MTTPIDQEIHAIKTLLEALEPLEPKVRESVLGYVLQRLDIEPAVSRPRSPGLAGTPPLPPGESTSSLGKQDEQIHIKELKNQKQPRSAIEMATLVAYYLSHKAPPSERKQKITTKDIETYFKIADFHLPTKPQFTLPNTKTAGYLDAVGSGEYKLNPVGYNLVVHSMPKTRTAPAARSSKRKEAAAKQKRKSIK
jgi:hypothetical protein